MDKSCQSSGDSMITTTTSGSRDQYLKNLNKLSHKISKPIITKKPLPPPFDHHTFTDNNTNASQSQQQQQPQPQTQSQVSQQQNLLAQQHQPQQHQPPVYNINKNDFRDVVQKLTGSPAHDRFSTPPPIHPPKPPSSRLQRIRPPPLVHVSNRPPPLINSAHHPYPPHPNASVNPPMPIATATNSFIQRPSAPLSPLPPFPAVHAAAESPVSAYMRYLQNSTSSVDSYNQFSGFSPLGPLVSPRWNNPPSQQPSLFPNQNQQQFSALQQGIVPSPTSGMLASQPQFPLPTSPLPFGCLNSPRSGLLLSPSSFPLSPTLPLSSPRWRAL